MNKNELTVKYLSNKLNYLILDSIFDKYWNSDANFQKLIKKYYAKIEYQKRKEYRTEWQRKYRERKKNETTK